MKEYEHELKIGSRDDMLAHASKINSGALNMDINQTIENIIKFYESGGNPQQAMQTIMQKNNNIGKMQNQLQNMAQGRSPKEFLLQLARQNGVNEKNLQGLSRILG